VRRTGGNESARDVFGRKGAGGAEVCLEVGEEIVYMGRKGCGGFAPGVWLGPKRL